MSVNSRISGLRDASPQERLQIVTQQRGIPADRLAAFDVRQGLDLERANHMVENVVGMVAVPLGVATNFIVDGDDCLVPMATEEPSVVAAASNAARMARPHGGFITSHTGPVMIAQIQLVDVADPRAARLRIYEAEGELLELANEEDPVLQELGGGAVGLEVRILPTALGEHIIVHLHVDVRDAMGANAVNSMAEALAPRLQALTGARPLLRILSNKADLRVTRVRATFDSELLGGPAVVDDILLASAFATADPFRAATHNKGIMNGVTAVVLATGNDTRAVEAGCHSFAAREGAYRALSSYEKDDAGNLVGTMELPLAVGLVGGATKAHPAAQASIALIGADSAQRLAAVITSVGLAQNLAACRALAAEGIQRGHMALHARTVAASAGAEAAEISEIARRIVAAGRIRIDEAGRELELLRAGK